MHYKALDTNPTKLRCGQLRRFLKSAMDQGAISKGLYRYLAPSDARTPQLYGLPKIHKVGVPMRPIVSASGSFNYNLAKFLAFVFGKYATATDSYVKNSADFVRKLSTLSSSSTKLVSFDVTSLFTMVPVDEASTVALEMYAADPSPSVGLPSAVLRDMITFATTRTNCQFDGRNFDQIEGTAMGSPFSPILANIYMCKWESQALGAAPFTPPTWIRYVDDTFVRFPDTGSLEGFFQYINTVHPSIQFTMDSEIDGAIPFLDVCVSRSADQYVTSVFRKPTNTDLYVRWDSAHPPGVKIGILKTLLHRAQSICSSQPPRISDGNAAPSQPA